MRPQVKKTKSYEQLNKHYSARGTNGKYRKNPKGTEVLLTGLPLTS